MSTDRTTILTSKGSAISFPQGNAFPTFDNKGNVTMVSSAPLCYKGAVHDLNEAVKLGIYVPASDCLNLPEGRMPNTSDHVIVLSFTGIYGVQIYIPLDASAILIRRFVNTSNFGAWCKFEGIQIKPSTTN